MADKLIILLTCRLGLTHRQTSYLMLPGETRHVRAGRQWTDTHAWERVDLVCRKCLPNGTEQAGRSKPCAGRLTCRRSRNVSTSSDIERSDPALIIFGNRVLGPTHMHHS